MARITVEDCLTKETNRFALVQLAARRTKQILNGARVLIPDSKGNKAVVTSLREIADGHVAFMNEEDLRRLREREKQERQTRMAVEDKKVEESKMEVLPHSLSDNGEVGQPSL
jgi:DNA-directed RNA polymerase subunit omega